eukprot:m51a1_g2022 putative longevity-assurance family protein (388) ;mRNA; f:1290319-1291757
MQDVEKYVLYLLTACVPLFGLMWRDMALYLEQRRRYAPPENRSTFRAPDLAWSLVFALAIGLSRWAYFRFAGPLLGRITKIKPHYDSAQRAARKERLVQNSFGLLFYVVATVVGNVVLADKDWAPRAFVWGATGHPDNCWSNYWSYDASRDVRMYYAFGLGHSLHAMYFQLLHKERRRDFLEMMVHHIVTVLLITLSYVYGYTRIGTLVLLVHDFSDVFICLARAANECTPDWVVALSFVLLNASWVYLRLFCYPFMLVWSATFRAVPIVNAQGFEGHNAGYWPFNVLLWVLYVLHLFWFAMFLKMWYYMIAKSSLDDVVNKVPDTPQQQASKPKAPAASTAAAASNSSNSSNSSSSSKPAATLGVPPVPMRAMSPGSTFSNAGYNN